MSYQVLARKYRPRTFRALVGQEHVLKALVNALDHQRLHHAYLFTGTRGVGKTTIARILAKCLNCESGVSSEPCDQCSACREISEGRFVDLIEVDAASRTKVEDTRELLDNVQYAPTRGRYKIYLIDEVHMLSNHSFNALLKTLEEPPEHVKFLLATTDPQKLPVTILSRCLQFNLKNMSAERIVGHLQQVLEQEVIPFEDAALWQLARSADGSMRDALSLADQAISYGGGKVSDDDVRAMLGTIDHSLIAEIVEALAQGDGGAILAAVARFAELAPDFSAALADLLTLLHRVAIAQALPEALDNSYGDRSQILQFAQQLAPEDVQLFYQTALLGRRDLPLASDPRSGFEMTLLRMLAFKPQGVVDIPSRPLVEAPASATQEDSASEKKPQADRPLEPLAPLEQVREPPPAPTSPSAPGTQPAPAVAEPPSAPPAAFDPPPWREAEAAPPEPSAQQSAPVESEPRADIRAQLKQQIKAIVGSEGLRQPAPGRAPANADAAPAPVVSRAQAPIQLAELVPENWPALYGQLDVKGILQSTAANCVLSAAAHNQLHFILDQRKGSLYDNSHAQRLQDLLSDYLATPVKVAIDLGEIPAGLETPAQAEQRLRAARQAAAIEQLNNDPVVQTLVREFGATLNEGSVAYSDSDR